MSCHPAQQLDRLGYGRSAAHRVDSRAKLLLALIFIVCVTSFPKHAVAPLVPLLAVPLALGILGRVPWRPVGRLLLWAAPLAVLPGLLNPLLDRAPGLRLGDWEVPAGWLSLASIALRFLLCTGMALVLVATTSMAGLLQGLRRLRVPAAFVNQLQLLYRYLFEMVDEGARMSLARRLREPRRALPRLGTAGRLLSLLVTRAWERAERIAWALEQRGFRGEFPCLPSPAWRARDTALLLGGSAFCLAARFAPVTDWVGHLIV